MIESPHRLVLIIAAITLCACTSSTEQVLEVGVGITNPRYGDRDPHEWSGRKPWNYPVHGIDVAKYQGAIDWQRARRSGVSFAFIKATEGGDHLDEQFKKNWAAARRSGVLRGAYHFYYFCTTAAKQARWFIRHVPREDRTLPPVLDVEWNHKSPTCRKRPNARKVRSEMAIFLGRLARHYGKRPIIYATVDFFKENELWRIKGYEFWLRSVADHPSVTYPRQRWTFWQYTGTGIIPGIKGDTDINVFYGSRDQWKNWIEKRAK